MVLLNYNILADDSYTLSLVKDKTEKIDTITSRYYDKFDLISNVEFNDKIGMFLYDNEDNFNESDINNFNLELLYQLESEDIRILKDKFSFTDTDIVDLDILYLNNALKRNVEVLKRDILKYNPSLKGYLKSLEDLDKYYLYMRIIDSYYVNKESFNSPKKLLLK